MTGDPITPFRAFQRAASRVGSQMEIGLLGAQQIRHLEEDQLIVVGLAEGTAGRERQVVVVADDDVIGIDHVDILDGEERESELAVLAALAGDLVGIVDVHQVDVTDLLYETVGVGLGEIDLVAALELRRQIEAVGLGRPAAGLRRIALAVVALDDEATGGVDEVEVADGIGGLLKGVFPALAGELAPAHVELQDAQEALAVLVLEVASGLYQVRAFEQPVEIAAVGHGMLTL